MSNHKQIAQQLFKFALILIAGSLEAANVNVDLSISQKPLNFTGKNASAIVVNDQLPGPILRFKQGDSVRINVHNRLHVGTGIHWHGVLVPWQMDGVVGVTQLPIAPGETFKYEFSLQQAGTYWYHAHSGLQEQQGLYGAFIVEPKIKPKYKYNKDIVVVLSDWSNTPAQQIMQNLKQDGMYYMAQDHDMHNMDATIEYNDVAYDALLINGHAAQKPWLEQVKVDDVVRLRFICAAASTMFRVKIPNAVMQTINIQGNDVKPYDQDQFVISPGETHDVLITVKQQQPYIIYAESVEQKGSVFAGLLTADDQTIDASTIAKFAPIDPKELQQQYMPIVAAVPTNDPHKQVAATLKFDLSGNMQNYTWDINGQTGYQAQPIILEQNKRYRFIFTNSSSMPHPMHVHGHWFILRKDPAGSEYDPLLHTVLVMPNSQVTVDVDTDASGQWIMHCHMLYHMHAGMYRILRYNTLEKVFTDEMSPQNLVEQTAYVNRPIVRVDEMRRINPSLIQAPQPH